MKKEKIMMDIPLLEGVADQVKEAFLSMSRTKKWARGELIVSEGDDCTSLFIVTHGVAAVQKYTSSGEFSMVRLIDPGCCFGEELVFGKKARFAYALEAVSDVTIVTVPMEQLQEMMDQYPQIRDNYLKVLFKRTCAQDQRITLLSLKTVRQKIAYYLLSLSDPKDPESVTLPVPKEVVAKYLAIPRPSFSRELSLMEKEGSIKVTGRTIDLVDLPSLRKELGEV